jgi:hypothetical protein
MRATRSARSSKLPSANSSSASPPIHLQSVPLAEPVLPGTLPRCALSCKSKSIGPSSRDTSNAMRSCSRSRRATLSTATRLACSAYVAITHPLIHADGKKNTAVHSNQDAQASAIGRNKKPSRRQRTHPLPARRPRLRHHKALPRATTRFAALAHRLPHRTDPPRAPRPPERIRPRTRLCRPPLPHAHTPPGQQRSGDDRGSPGWQRGNARR